MQTSATSQLSLWACLILSLFAFGVICEINDGTVIELTPNDLHQLSKGDWFVEIYAPWCGFCKKLEPIYAKVASSLKGKVNVAKIDGDKYKELAMQFFVSGFPTIYFIHDGEVRSYDRERREEAFIEFANGGYQKVDPVAAYMNPLSPIGKFVGFFGKGIQWVVDTSTELQEGYNIPLPAIVIIGAIGTALLSLVAVIMLEGVVSFVGSLFGGSKPRTTPSQQKQSQSQGKANGSASNTQKSNKKKN